MKHGTPGLAQPSSLEDHSNRTPPARCLGPHALRGPRPFPHPKKRRDACPLEWFNLGAPHLLSLVPCPARTPAPQSEERRFEGRVNPAARCGDGHWQPERRTAQPSLAPLHEGDRLEAHSSGVDRSYGRIRHPRVKRVAERGGRSEAPRGCPRRSSRRVGGEELAQVEAQPRAYWRPAGGRRRLSGEGVARDRSSRGEHHPSLEFGPARALPPDRKLGLHNRNRVRYLSSDHLIPLTRDNVNHQYRPPRSTLLVPGIVRSTFSVIFIARDSVVSAALGRPRPTAPSSTAFLILWKWLLA
jgi:hypothetical protein